MSTLCIVKTHRNNKFSSINLTAEEDKSLSWGAKGLHTYLISRPPDWKVYFSELLERSKDGKKGLRSFIRELCAGGYLDWTQVKDDKTKRFKAIHYDVYEEKNQTAIENNKKRAKKSKSIKKEKTIDEPHTHLADSGFPVSGEVESASPVSGKEATTINHSSINQNSNNQILFAPQNGAVKNTAAQVKSSEPSNFEKLIDWWYRCKGEENPGLEPPRYKGKRFTDLVSDRINTDKKTWEQIASAMTAYWKILQSPEHYYTSKGDIAWFMAVAIDRFWEPSEAWENFKKADKKKNNAANGKSNGHYQNNGRQEYPMRTSNNAPTSLAELLNQIGAAGANV